MAKMTRDERLLLVGMITIADDSGRLTAAPTFLQGQIYPYDEDVSPRKVRTWRDAVVAKNPNIRLYAEDGVEYIELGRFRNYNAPHHEVASRIPAAPDFSGSHPEVIRNESGTEQEAVGNSSRVGVGSGVGSGVGADTDVSAYLPLLGKIPGYVVDRDKDTKHLRVLVAEFPNADPRMVIGELATWALDHKLGANPRLRLRRFFANRAKWNTENAHKDAAKGKPTTLSVEEQLAEKHRRWSA